MSASTHLEKGKETTSGLINGFKEFIARGNAVELAVGVVIGAAFGSIVSAITDKVLNPLIAGIFGKPNFDNVLEFSVGGATVQPGAVITALVNFLIVALAIYLCVVVPMNKLANMRRKQENVETEPENEPVDENLQVLIQIRDLLQQGAQPLSHNHQAHNQ